MKRLFLVLLLILNPCLGFDYSFYCSDIKPSKTASGIIMSTSGANFLTRKIVQKEIAKALKKETGSDFKVHFNSFWGTNIAKGEFSGLKAVSKNYSDKKLKAQNLEITTICPYNKIGYKNDKLIFDTNIILNFVAEVNEANLSEMLKQKVQIIDDKIVVNCKASAFGIKMSMKIKAGLKVVNNRIQLCNIEIKNKTIDTSKYLSALNLTNFSIDLNKALKADVKIEDIKIYNSKVYLSGFVIVPKS